MRRFLLNACYICLWGKAGGFFEAAGKVMYTRIAEKVRYLAYRQCFRAEKPFGLVYAQALILFYGALSGIVTEKLA